MFSWLEINSSCVHCHPWDMMAQWLERLPSNVESSGFDPPPLRCLLCRDFERVVHCTNCSSPSMVTWSFDTEA